MKRLALSLLLVGLLFPASAAAVKVKTEWEPIMPSLSFTIECQGEYVFERCPEWDLELGSRFYYHYPAEEGVRENSRIGRFSNPKAGEVEVPYDCELTGSVSWTVHAKTYSGAEETTSGDSYIPYDSDLCVKPYKIHRRISRKEAEKEVLARLSAYYVSRLRCHRAGRGFRCETIYSNTYRACRSTYRVDKYFEHSYGGDRVFVQIYTLRKHCDSF